MRCIKILLCILLIFSLFSQVIPAQLVDTSHARQEMYLKQLLSVLPPERPERGRVSVLDETWQDWLKRTGELPPDFGTMPSIPFLPDPLILDARGENITIETISQWHEKQKWIRAQIKHWITGTFPPPPENLKATILSDKLDGRVTLRTVELRFGPDHRAKLTLELLIPPGDGPFPVFLTQSNHRGWALVAVRRGYIGCTYAGNDGNDDTETYADIWYPEYDFTRLMRRAWGAHRAVDYLYTQPFVDKDKIGITGHSRDGKQSLMAAAFDERITAVVPSSGNTGEQDPWRYNSDKFDNETILQITTNFPHWMHPRLRFFIGREHKLPVDQNLMATLVAPRGLMFASAITEHQGNPWGIEQNYLSVRKVYKFLGAEDKIVMFHRDGRHSTAARDIDVYVDFFDTVFSHKNIDLPQKLCYDYTFNKWLGLSDENINPLDYPVKDLDDLLVTTNGSKITTATEWEQKKVEAQLKIQWGLGDEPAGAVNPGPTVFGRTRDEYLGNVISRPEATETMGRTVISDRGGQRGFGDYLIGNFYYPIDKNGDPVNDNLPVIIYLHEYAYPTGFARYLRPLGSPQNSPGSIIEGFVSQGFAVFTFDQIGFGTRIEEGTNFYQRYPHWSKMGRMVADTKSAVQSMVNLKIVDNSRIYVAGYSLGGTVGLYTAALDERIAGVISICGFTPMRLDTADKGTEGVRAYSHLHGLLPRLGFFAGHENRIPYDFHEILACIAPRPVMVVAPTWDRDATFDDVKLCMDEVKNVFKLYNSEDSLLLEAPNDYNRFSHNMQMGVYRWAKKNF